ncbi:MAG: hypothetical protein LUH02_00180 [Erysipelotrichaceae bacterium]|nr:hypothetical protein [Erysipelotrichaceae bacterium]
MYEFWIWIASVYYWFDRGTHSYYLPIKAIILPLAFAIPAFNEAGIVTFIMLSRHMFGLKNIPKRK